MDTKHGMFVLRYLNSSGEEEMRGHLSEADKVLAELESALETLKTLPAGTKLEITYEGEEK